MHADDIAVLGHRRGAGHVVQRLEPVVGVHAEAAVVLEQDHPVAGAQPGGRAAVIGDLAAGDEETHPPDPTGRTAYARHAVAEWTARATHPDTGRRIEWDGIDLIQVRDGRICRNAVYSSAHRARALDSG